MAPGKHEEKQLKETQTLQQGQPPVKNMSRTAGVAGVGDRKDSTPNKPQKRHYDKANLCRNEGEQRRNTREK